MSTLHGMDPVIHFEQQARQLACELAAIGGRGNEWYDVDWETSDDITEFEGTKIRKFVLRCIVVEEVA